tara:strand:- start:959 stop:1390 length:432 start_codon:yes stop_codon:yes gene_type:complete
MVIKNEKKRKLILDRLQMLLNLCYKTIPDETENALFHEHMIEAEKMKDLVRDEEHWNDLYPEEIANIMVNANRIWKIRNRIKKGELPNDYLSDVRDLMEDYVKQGQKINAIKLYRKNHDCTLREAKEYADSIQKDLRIRGLIT